MKPREDIKNLRSKVIEKCFDKFTANQDGLREFVSFLAKKLDSDLGEQFAESVTNSIEAKNKFQFKSSLISLDLDYKSLQQIDNVAKLGFNELLENDQKIEEGSDLYRNLVFVCTLPKAFKNLTEGQMSSLQDLNLGLFGEKAKALTNKDYSGINKLTKRKLFEYVQSDLFGEEADIGKANRLFISKLAERLDEMGIEGNVVNFISGELIDFQSDLNKQIKAEPKIKGMMVRKGLASSEDVLDVTRNEVESANDTYIVINRENGKKFYAKSFDQKISLGGKLNPNEVFLYKVMEYVGYGPKTEFLVELGSSSAGKSSIFKGNFILTEDVRRRGQEFFLDIEGNNEDLRKFAECNPKKFAIEISAVAALTDILSLSDVFGQNAKNYGIAGNPDNPSEYKLQFVDHQPNPENGFFSVLDEEEKLTYSPRESLSRKYLLRADKTRESSPLSRLASKSRGGEFAKIAIQEDVYQKFFYEQSDGKPLLEAAVLRAKDDVVELVVRSKENFIEDAIENHLNKYIEKITKNMEIYRKSIGKGSQEGIDRK